MSVQQLDNAHAEAAHGLLWSTLHEQNHLVGLDQLQVELTIPWAFRSKSLELSLSPCISRTGQLAAPECKQVMQNEVRTRCGNDAPDLPAPSAGQGRPG